MNKKFELSSSSNFTRICRLKLAAYCCPTQARPLGSTDLSFKSLYCEFKIENFLRRSEGVTNFRRKRFDRLTFGLKDVELICRNLAFLVNVMYCQHLNCSTPHFVDMLFHRHNRLVDNFLVTGKSLELVKVHKVLVECMSAKCFLTK